MNDGLATVREGTGLNVDASVASYGVSSGAARSMASSIGDGAARAGSIGQIVQNFNQPVQTPAEYARHLRMQQTYGLAAAKG